jgi:putative transposase
VPSAVYILPLLDFQDGIYIVQVATEFLNMGQTLSNITIHIIFSTKGRAPTISSEIKNDLMAYLGGIIREHKAIPIIINGTSDHVHMLVEIPPSLSVSELMRFVKSNSSRWLNQTYPSTSKFAWQDGFGAFSISKSAIEIVINYIKNQEIHHQTRSFQDEFITFLEKYQIDYDARYIWD